MLVAVAGLVALATAEVMTEVGVVVCSAEVIGGEGGSGGGGQIEAVDIMVANVRSVTAVIVPACSCAVAGSKKSLSLFSIDAT